MGNQLELLRKILSSYNPANVDPSVSPLESMPGDNYMWVGESAAKVIATSLAGSHLTDVKTVLDLPCGHGRVLRHLLSMFPDASFDVCDLDKDGVNFCVEHFGARAVEAHLDLTRTKFDRKYDLIWIGSLFTHLPKEKVSSWLAFLSQQLTDNGVIVATFHGRWSTKMQKLIPYTDSERWAVALSGYEDQGYGYVDYAPGLGHDFVPGSYGVSLARPSTLLDMIESIPGIRIFHYQEKGWGDNQDVIAIGKPAWGDIPLTWPKETIPDDWSN